MYLNQNGFAGVAAPRLPAGFVAIPVPVELRRRTPGAPALFIVRTPPRGVRGLGDSYASPYQQAYSILAQDTLSAVNNGSFSSGAAFKAGVGADVMGICNSLKDFQDVNHGNQVCPPDMSAQIDQAAAAYDAWLAGHPYTPPSSYSQSTYGQVPDVYYFNAPPGYQKNPYTGQLEQIPGWPQSVNGGTYPNTATQAVISAPVVYTQAPASSGGGQSPSARVTNLTRPGQAFQVGDSYMVNVTGPANSQVAVTGTKDGASLGTTPMGSTDGSGNFSKQGTMDGSTVGNWSETWLVNGSSVGSVSFTVSAKPAVASAPPASSANTGNSSSSAPTPSGSGGGSPAPSGSSGGVNQSGGGGSPAPNATGGVSLSDFFSNSFNVGGFEIPVWGAAAVVIGGILLMTRSGK